MTSYTKTGVRPLSAADQGWQPIHSPGAQSAARLQQFLQADPDNLALVCSLLDALQATHGSAAVIEWAEQLSPLVHSAPDTQLRIARAWLASGDCNRAIDVLAPLLAIVPEHRTVRHDLAFAQLCIGDFEAAHHTLAPVFENDRVPIEYRTLQARVLRARGDLTGAVELLRGEEVDVDAVGLRALLQLDAGDAVAAEFDAMAALARQPAQIEALLVVGTLALWSRALDPAAACFNKILRVAPQTGRALAGLGQVQLLRGDIVGARQVLQAATQAMPDHLGTWHALAWTCLVEADVPSASAAFQSAYVLDRTFGETHGGIALIHVLRHERAEAEAAIKRALRLDPTVRTARYAQSLLLLEQGDAEAATREVAGILDHVALPEGMSVAAFLERLRQMMEHS